MRGWRRSLKLFLIPVLFLSLAAAYFALRSYGQIATGFYAKILCSGVFVAGRPAQHVIDNDILVYSPKAMFAAIRASVDLSAAAVDTRLPMGLGHASARYRDGVGCALFQAPVREAGVGKLGSERSDANAEPAKAVTERTDATFRIKPATDDPEQPWPIGSKVEGNAVEQSRREKLALAIERGFAEADSKQERRTRAIVIVHKGQIVAERYADGFGPHTRMAGWSMAKSITSAWIGVLTQQSGLSVDEPLALSAWKGGSDARSGLRFRELLHMSSGLEFSEAYGSPFSDVNRMLFFSESAAGYAAQKQSVLAAGAVFNYSSGTTNLIAQALRERLGSEYLKAPYQMLFERIGMSSALFETDAAGTFVGSSYVYASPRDWARFGLLFLQDGIWNQQRILPEGWVAFSVKSSAANPNYGAHWWLHEPGEKQGRTVPPDLFQATGHAGQRVSIIPSRELVIVRLGMTLTGAALRHAELVNDVIKALD